MRSADYLNMRERDEASESLLQFSKVKILNTTVNCIKKKVDSKRASFRKELRKVVKDSSNITTTAANFFDRLIFLTEVQVGLTVRLSRVW